MLKDPEKTSNNRRSIADGYIFPHVINLLLHASLFGALITCYLMIDDLANQVTGLQSDIEDLKSQIIDHERVRRQVPFGGGDIKAAEKSGVNVLDYAYGVNLKQGPSQLSVYPTLMGEEMDYLDTNFQQQNQFQDHNQLGVIRQSGGQSSKSSTSQQSAYAKRVNAFRHSRVASTPEVEIQVTTTSSTPTPPPQPPKSLLRSMDFDTSRLFDSLANPTLSLHVQARHSLDESSTDLETGIHNSWRLSPWSKRLHGASLFTINEENGEIEVPENGLYFVYAQIEYLDSHETNGFEVNVDNDATLSCVVSTSGEDEKMKHNTCHTSGIMYLQKGSVINVKDKEAGRYSLLHSKGTFFGMTKISSC